MRVYLAYRRWFWNAIFRTAFLVFVAMAFGACQEVNEVQEVNKVMKDPKGSLEKKAEAYWKMRFLEKDYEGTYAMEADQGTMTLKKYRERIANNGQIKYMSVAATKVQVDGVNGTVEILVTYLLPNLPKQVSSPIADRWVIKENEWKHLSRKPGVYKPPS
jgi:hypothetical protein